MLTYTGEQDDSNKITKSSCKTADYRLDEVVAVLCVSKSNTQNCAVRSDKRKINSECVIETYHALVHEHLNYLYQCRDDKYEYYGLEIYKIKRYKYEIIYKACYY